MQVGDWERPQETPERVRGKQAVQLESHRGFCTPAPGSQWLPRALCEGEGCSLPGISGEETALR